MVDSLVHIFPELHVVLSRLFLYVDLLIVGEGEAVGFMGVLSW